MTDAEGPVPYEKLKERAWKAVKDGRSREGLALFDEALAWAQGHGEDRLIDRAFCNRAGVLVEMGCGRSVHQQLRRILLKNTDTDNSFLAAYTLARGYEVSKDVGKALFYARIAHRYARLSGNREWLSSSHNQLGNLGLANSDFETARVEFERALAFASGANDLRQALALDNLGYCQVIRGRYRRGFRAHFQALRIIRRNRARIYEPVVQVSLCFAYLEIGRHRRAIQHAHAALRLAEETDNTEMRKNALFLLGEAFKLAGDPLAARHHFAQLQEDFYPEASGVADLLLLINVQRLVNIKA